MDEAFVFLASLGIIVWRFGVFYMATDDIWPKQRIFVTKVVFFILPLAALFGIYVILRTIAAFDVVNDGFYIFFYLFLGFAWLALGIDGFYYILDISWRDDCLEGNNQPALIAFIGAFLGFASIYAGANVGDGPGWWCVIFAAGVGAMLWFFFAYMLQRTTDIIEKVTMGRDLNAAYRLALYLAASGLILGRGAAGDWTSFTATIIEFAVAWPLMPLFIVAYYVEGSTATKSGENNSLLWGGVYAALVLIAFISAVFTAEPIAALVKRLH